MRQIPGTDGIDVTQLTGGRYGHGGVMAPAIEAVIGSEPVFGFGLPGLATSTDAAWVEMLVLSGIVGVLCLGVVLAAMLVGFAQRRTSLAEPERRLFSGVVAILVISSFGFPSLTDNRLSVIAWVLVTLLMTAPTLPDHRSRSIKRDQSWAQA